MRVLVVDDEGVARRRLVRMLSRIDDVEVAGEAASGDEALERIAAERPDVVLLDIRMPGMDGLQLAAGLPDPAPHVIFTTAYQEYAVQAFEHSAVDYLLKPVEADRLETALNKIRRLSEPQDVTQLRRMLQQVLRGSEPPRLTARLGESLHVLDPRAVARFHAQEGYTAFRHQGRDYLIDDSIASLAERLEPWGFLRVHRSEVINLNRVRAIRREQELTVVDLDDGQNATVSRRHLPELRRRLGISAKS
jgi:two-component system LytT family response regulator